MAIFNRGKFSGRKCKITLTDIINKQLDSMEDTSVLDVFQPKISSQLEFFDIINKAVEEENTLNVNISCSDIKKQKQGNVKISKVTDEDIQKFPMFLLIILGSLFVLFIIICFKIFF